MAASRARPTSSYVTVPCSPVREAVSQKPSARSYPAGVLLAARARAS